MKYLQFILHVYYIEYVVDHTLRPLQLVLLFHGPNWPLILQIQNKDDVVSNIKIEIAYINSWLSH